MPRCRSLPGRARASRSSRRKRKKNISTTSYGGPTYKLSQSTSPSPATTPTYKQTYSATPAKVSAPSSKSAKSLNHATTPTSQTSAKTEPKAQTSGSRTESASTTAAAAAPDKAVKKRDSNDEVFADGPVTVPPGYNPKSEKANRREKTMSISKSGRHKFRARQRSSVLEGDIFGEGSSRMLSSTGSYESGATCRDIEPASSSGFALAPGQPTAV